MVNQIELNQRKPTDKLDIIPVTAPPDPDAPSLDRPRPDSEQLVIEFPTDAFRDAMYARIVAKVGERRYWETWAKDVADIAGAHITRIRGLIAEPESNQA
jgi:predicted helicase